MTTPVYPADLIDANGQTRAGNLITFPDGVATPNTILGPFPFVFNSAGLTSGVLLYTPTIGDVIYDIGIAIPTAFDGTTPLADVGTFNGGNNGLFKTLAGAAVDLTTVDVAVGDNAGLSTAPQPTWLAAAVASVGAAGGAAFAPSVLYVTAANPLLLVISQDGTKGGAATGATVGACSVYLVAGSPAGA